MRHLGSENFGYQRANQCVYGHGSSAFKATEIVTSVCTVGSVASPSFIQLIMVCVFRSRFEGIKKTAA